MRTYTQLTREQRYQIYALLNMGHTKAEIANALEVHKSTISRELQRNRGRRAYRPKQAHALALGRRDKGRRRLRPEDWAVMEDLLRQDWSPEQISNWLKQRTGIRVSHEWIYQHILADKQAGGDLYRHLRCQKKRRKRYGRYDRRGKLPHTTSIEQRPALVGRRERLGDWEVDTLVGKDRRHSLVTLTERKSRFTVLKKVERKAAELVAQAIYSALQPLINLVHTITADNGKEFAWHLWIASMLKAAIYFAHPYAAWERGTNENTNGLLRQYFPKNRDFATITDEELEFAMQRLNHRPRKCLDFKSPSEVLSGCT
jgi:transposase, IS30 family